MTSLKELGDFNGSSMKSPSVSSRKQEGSPEHANTNTNHLLFPSFVDLRLNVAQTVPP